MPPAAASAEASPKASMWMRWTLMPQTWATSRLCDTARMALPSRVFWRNRKASAVIAAANRHAMTRDFENAKGPMRNEPVMNSTERRSEVKASWARFTRAMEMPKVRSSEDSSGASTTRRTRKCCRRTPITNTTGIETRSERYGFSPTVLKSKYVM